MTIYCHEDEGLPVPPAQSGAQRSGVRVLIVDDYLDTAASMAQLLELLGHDVRQSDDPHHALTLVGDWVPQVALVDLSMRDMGGIEFADRLRVMCITPIICVAVTGYARKEDKAQALAAGFAHFLVKPVELDALLQILAAV